MRFTPITLIAFLVGCSFCASAQTITFSGKNVELRKVFTAIKQQTGYMVLGDAGLLKTARPVSLDVRDMPLSNVLEIILKDQTFKYRIDKKTIILFKKNGDKLAVDFKSTANKNLIDIRGRIVNEQGEPVIATIAIKGASQATSTNSAGDFLLNEVDENAVLIITGVTIETLEIRSNVDLRTITVKTKIKEEETVTVANTGYQKVKPNEINGSVVVIDNKKLNEQTGTNIIDRLKGVTNGMLFNSGKLTAQGPNQTSNPYTIRGLSTINGLVAPLIVVDNFPYKGDITSINPADVQSITILKDAAATSIYGASGGNGVIVITTKRSSFNQKFSVSVNVNTLISERPDLDNLYHLSSAEYIDLEEFLFNNAFDFGGRLVNAYTPITPAVQVFLNRRDRKISAEDSARQIDALKQIDSREQLYNYFYQNAITSQYSVNLSGGSSNLAWLIAGNYDKVVTDLGAQNNRFNIYFRNTYRPVKKMNIELGVYYTTTHSENGKPSPSPIRNAPYIQYADENGNPLSVPNGYRESFLETLPGIGQLLDWKYYPLEEYKHGVSNGRTDDIRSDLSIRYQLLKSMDINLLYQYQRQTGGTESVADKESYAVRGIVNSFTNLNYPTTEPQLRNPVPYGNILTQTINGPQFSYNFRVQSNFNKTIGEHSIAAFAGFEVRNNVKEADNFSTIYNYSTNPSFYGVVDYVKEYRDFVTGSPKRIGGAPGKTLMETYDRAVSIFGNAVYTFRKMYSFSVSARKDAANIFGLSTNDKWKPLWSAGIGWQISEEKFYHFEAIPSLRLKVTYGYSGNVDPSKSASARLFFTGGIDPDTRMPRARIISLSNKELRWEKTGQVNIGVDFSSSKGIVSGSIDYYSKKSTDLYGQSPIDITYGVDQQIQNTADIVSNGVDVQINTININRALKWNSTFIFNYSTEKTLKYFGQGAQNLRDQLGIDGNSIVPIVGKPLYAIIALPWGGLNARGNPQGYDVNGKLSSDYTAIYDAASPGNIIYKGTTTPLFFGALNNQFAWKNLFFNCNILYNLGYYFRKPALDYQSMLQTGLVPADFTKRWKKPGDELLTNIPSFIYPLNNLRDLFYQDAEVNVLRADHIRLQYINAGYSFSKNKIQLAVNIANLNIFLWRANKEHIDPESPSSTTIPRSKIYTISLRANL